ncbi:MAG TPA: hypothetical protein VG900_13590 [Hyphomicrobiaceae bacterium]|jgi:hypothetical protein|nr:hypothetical protein [Hyphomicrobiaceae bacterium]
MTMRVGDLVEVRSKEEILATLDKNGRLEGLPFMPQMLKYCGQHFPVYKVAHKTCDTVTGPAGLSVPNCIHLNIRCDGEAYGGCDAACLIFWKEAWLRPVRTGRARDPAEVTPSLRTPKCTELDLARATSTSDQSGETIYRCQAVCLRDYTSRLPWWDFRQYLKDYLSGNLTLWGLFSRAAFVTYWHATQAARHRFGIGAPGRWLYDRFQQIVGGVPFPYRLGLIPLGQKTPTNSLNLQPGDLVRVKSHNEILKTLNVRNMNNGMSFDVEMVPFCGKTFRVKSRINTFIDEKTGRRKALRTPAVILEGVWCHACYSPDRMGCPRSIYSWWREIWLERVPEESTLRNATRPGESLGAERVSSSGA